MNRNDSAQAMQSLIGYYDNTDSEEEEEEDPQDHSNKNTVPNENQSPSKNNITQENKNPEYSELSASDIEIDIEDEDDFLISKSNSEVTVKNENTPDNLSSSEHSQRRLVSYDVSMMETPNKSMVDISMDDRQNIADSDGDDDGDSETLNRYRSPGDSASDSAAIDIDEYIEIEGLPPAPTAKCPQSLQDKILSFHMKMRRDGIDLNTVIQERKDFRNPSIYEKLVQYCDIDEKGTNYPLSLYDPTIFGPESYYEELAKSQKIEMDKIEKDKKDRTKVEFVTGMKKNHLSDTDLKRKSKWDDPKEEIKKRFNFNRI